MNFKISSILACVAIALIGLTYGCSDNCTVDEIAAFKKFKTDFQKSYNTAADECTACDIFCQHYRLIEAHNNNPNSTFKMTITSSTDQSSNDCRSTGFIEPPASHVAKRKTSSSKLIRKAQKVKSNQFSSNTVQSTKEPINNGPLTGPVKDQGNCGSCWAFCAGAVLQYQAKVYQNRSIEVSEQDFLECNAYASVFGCTGGNPMYAMEYAFVAGVVPIVKYPYRQTKENCRRSASMGQSYPTIGDATMADPKGDESVLRKIIDYYGVVATAMGTTTSFMLYSSGVFDDPSCPTKVSHCVAIVGYGSDELLGDYWIVKNSWGTDWGEAGYFRIKRGVNMCGIETASYYLPVPN